MPVLVDGDLALTESNEIMIYLCDKSGDAGRRPYPSGDGSLGARSVVNRWLF